jgi:hypothetical protein
MVMFYEYHLRRNRDSSVGTATGYELDGMGTIPGRGNQFFSSPQGPYGLWDPPSLLSNGYRGSVAPVV